LALLANELGTRPLEVAHAADGTTNLSRRSSPTKPPSSVRTVVRSFPMKPPTSARSAERRSRASRRRPTRDRHNLSTKIPDEEPPLRGGPEGPTRRPSGPSGKISGPSRRPSGPSGRISWPSRRPSGPSGGRRGSAKEGVERAREGVERAREGAEAAKERAQRAKKRARERLEQATKESTPFQVDSYARRRARQPPQ
jgi:hypothetical protein